MPIHAENRARYPKDWPQISMRIRRDRAGWQCEQVDAQGIRCGAVHGEPHPITGSKVILTVAHLDHTPEHCDPCNLAAMCQRCHLAYDRDHHAENRARRRRQMLATPDILEMANG